MADRVSKAPSKPDLEGIHSKSVFEPFDGEEGLDGEGGGIGEKAKTPKKKGKKSPGSGLASHSVVRQLLGKPPKKSKGGDLTGNVTPAQAELRIEDLDEALLKSSKTENEWYRNEIQTSERDATDYIKYLKDTQNEKQSAIDKLVEARKRDLEVFNQRKREKDEETKRKVNELKRLIQDLEFKLEAKQQEMMNLSDIVSKRSKYEAEIARIRKEIEAEDAIHQANVDELERSLLETRIKLQKEADAKIAEMEAAAQEKAAAYLSDHFKALEEENKKLERELRSCIVSTQDLLARKEVLEKENKELEREKKIQEDLLRMRVASVANAQKNIKNSAYARRVKSARVQQQIVADGLNRLPLGKIIAKNAVEELGLGAAGADSQLSVKKMSESTKLGSMLGSTAIHASTMSTQVRDNTNSSSTGKGPNKSAQVGDKTVKKLVVIAGSDQNTLSMDNGYSGGQAGSQAGLKAAMSEISPDWISDEEDDEYLE
ncbi:hypothetical protein HDU76_010224 [Blyttiomyces sp. JEL0837]|nr:hypothetical protein HDU76_010224 [Blyttiomyces sp. JEL0837]